MEFSCIVDSLRKHGSSFSIQDFVLALLCLSATYLLRARQTYDIQPSWHWDQNQAYYRNGNFPNRDEKLPPPLVTDLEGDGSSEILLLTYDLKLEVYAAPAACKDSCSVLPYLNLLQSVPLNLSVDARPVVIETGFIEALNETETAPGRNQVIVILTSNLDVLCYDSDLHLMWRTHLMDVDDPEGHYKVKAMSVLVTSHSLKKQDRGSVFIGVSFQHTAPKKSRKSKNPIRGPQMHQMGAGILDRHTISDDQYEHFSTFALHAHSGTIRWHHLPGDFEAKTDTLHEEGFFQWKLTIHDRMAHVGEVHWTKYLNYFLAHLPHQWSKLSDTEMKLTSLVKTRSLPHQTAGRQTHTLTPLMDILGLKEDHMEGLPFGGMVAHNQHEHVKVPTALLIHNHNGLQVLDLKSGRPISRMEAANEKCVYGDLDSDQVLDSVCVESEACLIQADMVYPNTNQIFSGPTCEAPSLFSSVSLMAMVTSHRYITEDPRLSLPPVLVKSVGKTGGLINHLLGHRIPANTQTFDSVVLTSSGRLTSYSHRGHLNWQVLIASGWDNYFTGQVVPWTSSRDDREQIYVEAFQPSLTPMSYMLYGKQKLALAMGWASISLVDLYDGYILAEHSLPCQPLQQPVIGDFNNDGRNDLIITCAIGHIGFTLEKQANHVYTAVVGVTVVLSISLLSWCCKPDTEEEEEEEEAEAMEEETQQD